MKLDAMYFISKVELLGLAEKGTDLGSIIPISSLRLGTKVDDIDGWVLLLAGFAASA